jgi:hypothetical protein
MEYIGYVTVCATGNSQVMHIKNSKQPTVPGDIAECCSVSETRSYCSLEHAALIPNPNHWISQYKYPQPLLILICSNVISCLLGSQMYVNSYINNPARHSIPTVVPNTCTDEIQ